MATATKTDPAKWEQAKRDAKARMGGKHSARAMQLATQLYKKRGGGYSGKKPSAKNNSLKKWGKQKWKWSGGSKDKGVYLPSAKVERLKSSKEGKKKLRAAGRKKSKATREGRQYSRHGLAAGTSLRKKASIESKKELLKRLFSAYKKFEKSNSGKAYRAASVAVNPATAGTYEALALTGKAAGKAADYVGPTLAQTMRKNPEYREAVMTALTKMSHVSSLEKVAMKQKLKKIVKELLGASKKHKGQAMRIKALIGKMKTSAAKRDPRLERAGVSGYNRVKRTPNHPTKSHIVVAKEGNQIRTIRFGQQGVKTNQTAGQREAFKSRHRKNIARGKMSAAYWADRAKWSPSKTKDKKNKKWVKGS